MLNENLLATLIVLLAVCLTAFGLDNGDFLKMVATTYLGYIIGNQRAKRGSDNETKKSKNTVPLP